jgi:hypothetical protein
LSRTAASARFRPSLLGKRILDGPCDGQLSLRVIIPGFIVGKSFTIIIFIIEVTLVHSIVCILPIFMVAEHGLIFGHFELPFRNNEL